MNTDGLGMQAAPAAPWPGRELAGGQAAMRAARRHSARVRKLRIVLPAVVILTLAAIIGSNMLAKVPISGNFSFGRVTLEDGKLTMENPRLTGFKKDSRSYELTAAKAIQDPQNTQVVHLRKIDGRMTQKDGKWTRLTADEGVYYSDKEKADLKDNIVVTSQSGHTVRLSAAHIDLKAGDVASDLPVNIEMLNGTLQAQSLRIKENGEVMFFNGLVRLNFVPARQQDAADAAR